MALPIQHTNLAVGRRVVFDVNEVVHGNGAQTQDVDLRIHDENVARVPSGLSAGIGRFNPASSNEADCDILTPIGREICTGDRAGAPDACLLIVAVEQTDAGLGRRDSPMYTLARILKHWRMVMSLADLRIVRK